MAKSDLPVYEKLTRKCNRRQQKICKITPHHAAAVHQTAKSLVDYFNGTSELVSANYCIGNDGSIGLCVSEDDRAWTSSSSWNDHRAVTIEVSNSENGEPWGISQAAYDSLVALCIDICKRNDIAAVSYDGTKNGVLTEHRMFSKTACPGTTLHEHLTSGKLARDINAGLVDALSDCPRKYVFGGVDLQPVFDPLFYGGKYPDLTAAGLQTEAQLFEHYIMFGIHEARQASKDFSPVAYKAAFDDLNDAFQDDWAAYVKHYLLFGREEVASGKRGEFM